VQAGQEGNEAARAGAPPLRRRRLTAPGQHQRTAGAGARLACAWRRPRPLQRATCCPDSCGTRHVLRGWRGAWWGHTCGSRQRHRRSCRAWRVPARGRGGEPGDALLGGLRRGEGGHFTPFWSTARFYRRPCFGAPGAPSRCFSAHLDIASTPVCFAASPWASTCSKGPTPCLPGVCRHFESHPKVDVSAHATLYGHDARAAACDGEWLRRSRLTGVASGRGGAGAALSAARRAPQHPQQPPKCNRAALRANGRVAVGRHVRLALVAAGTAFARAGGLFERAVAPARASTKGIAACSVSPRRNSRWRGTWACA
jgi:hypothetical protein